MADREKGESFVHGFTLALTDLNSYYCPISEQNTQADCIDHLLLPRIELYPHMKHSYTIKLKDTRLKDSETVVRQLRLQATGHPWPTPPEKPYRTIREPPPCTALLWYTTT